MKRESKVVKVKESKESMKESRKCKGLGFKVCRKRGEERGKRRGKKRRVKRVK